VLVTGLARTDVDRVAIAAGNGVSADRPIAGETLGIPTAIHPEVGNEPSHDGQLDVRPFALTVRAPIGATSLSITAHTAGDDEASQRVPIDPDPAAQASHATGAGTTTR
jgi:hypothetical protein